jgi:FixJ family two-component response regulator
LNETEALLQQLMTTDARSNLFSEGQNKTAFRLFDGIMMVSEARRVSVVDDDESVREALPDLLRVLGFETRAFSSALEFLESDWMQQTECLVLDVAMPGMSGPDLQVELKRRGQHIPIVFITAHKDEMERRLLIQAGASACLFKPFSDVALQDALDDVFS